MSPRRIAKGFTLVEVMISLALMAVLSAMTYTGISAMMIAQATIKESTTKTQAIQMAMNQWSQDWRETASLAIRPGAQYSGNAIRMVRASADTLGQVVAWRSTTHGLERASWPPANNIELLQHHWESAWLWTQRQSQTTQVDDTQAHTSHLWPMLHNMQVHYYMENSWTNPFNTDTSDGWPDAVRVRFDTDNGAITLDWSNPNIRSSGKK